MCGIDSSPAALGLARENIDRAGYGDQITLQLGDLLRLPLPDASYERVMCWGVLMHVPEVETAIGELASAGDLFIRVADPHWLAREFARHDASLVVRRPSALTDLHTRLPRPISALVQLANYGFSFTRWPGPALGNLFVFRRTAAA